MKWLQAVLLIVGNAVLGMMIVGVSLGFFSETIFARPNENGISTWGSAYGVIFAFLFGALIGLIVGLIHAATVIVRSEGLLWHRPTWLGILAGLAVTRPAVSMYTVVITAHFGTGSILHDLTEYAVGLMIFTIVLATLGGYAGWIVEEVAYSSK